MDLIFEYTIWYALHISWWVLRNCELCFSIRLYSTIKRTVRLACHFSLCQIVLVTCLPAVPLWGTRASWESKAPLVGCSVMSITLHQKLSMVTSYRFSYTKVRPCGNTKSVTIGSYSWKRVARWHPLLRQNLMRIRQICQFLLFRFRTIV